MISQPGPGLSRLKTSRTSVELTSPDRFFTVKGVGPFLDDRFPGKFGERQTMAKDLRADVVIVGGGLTGCLTALKLTTARPELSVLLVEAADRLAGRQTWFFHDSDLANATSLEWLKPVIAREWNEATLEFPHLARTRPGPCRAIRSEDLHRELKRKLDEGLLLNETATRLSESHIELASGRILAGRCVLDARGNALSGNLSGASGFKKFLSLEVELETDHGLATPLAVDATCTQLDGLRYFEILPWGERRLQITETFYSDAPDLNRERLLRSIRSFAGRKGWTIADEKREETGVIPVPLTSAYVASSQGGEALPIGQRGGYHHAFLGTILPDAVRNADFLATLDDLTTKSAREGLVKFNRAWFSRQRFYRLHNRWMFYASESPLRYMVMQSIFEHPADLVARFYAGQSTWTDRLRLIRRPPALPVERMLRCFSEKAIEKWAAARRPPAETTNLEASPPPTAKQAS